MKEVLKSGTVWYEGSRDHPKYINERGMIEFCPPRRVDAPSRVYSNGTMEWKSRNGKTRKEVSP